MLPMVGRLADAWHTFGDLLSLPRKWAIVAEHAERAGREASSIVRATDLSLSEPWGEVRARVEALHDLGFSYLVVSWPTEGRARVEEFVRVVMPRLP